MTKKKKKKRNGDDEEKKDDDEEKEEKKESWKFEFNHGERRIMKEEKEEVKEVIKKKDKAVKEVEMFVEREIKKNPAYVDFKEELLKSKSLEEAIEKLNDLEDAKEEPVRMDEGTLKEKPSWLGNRK
jgi:hypothetical protein